MKMRCFLLAIAVSALSAAEFCAVRLSIQNENSQPLQGGIVTVQDARSRVIAKRMIRQGIVEICELDFGPHTISVSSNAHLPVDIKDVRIVPDREQMLNVVLNPRASLIGGEGNSCRVYFRVVDSAGRGVPSSYIQRSSGKPLVTSAFGFASAMLRVGDLETFSVSASASPQEIELTCKERDIKDVTFRLRAVP